MTNIAVTDLLASAERARLFVQESFIDIPTGMMKVTMSLGVTAAEPGDTVETLVKRADIALYKSKESGRNRVTAAKAA